MALLLEHEFKPLPADKQIETLPFLEAVAHLPPFFGEPGASRPRGRELRRGPAPYRPRCRAQPWPCAGRGPSSPAGPGSLSPLLSAPPPPRAAPVLGARSWGSPRSWATGRCSPPGPAAPRPR